LTRPFPGDQLIDTDLGDEIKAYPPTLEVGRTGLKRAGGYVNDEFLPQLRGRQAVKVYREMSENSAILGAWLYTVTQLLRQIEWRVEPASSSPEDKANADFVEQCMDDMEVGFADFVAEACSCLVYGWSLHEIVFKRRQGLWAANEHNRSKFEDNKLSWRKFAIRSQESMLRWVFNEGGDVLAMVQMPAPRYQRIVLPMQRCLLFRPQLSKGSPEGKSLLRTAYRPWFMVKRFEEIEAVGIERDLTGLPVAYVPPNVLNPRPGSDEAKMLAAVKQAVTAVRRNEQEGLIWPLSYDDDRNLQYDFKLLTSGGSRQFNVDEVVQRYETRMLMSVMADFIMTGHENSGASYALHTDKSGIFRTGVNGIAKAIADPINRKAIPQLFKLNGMQPPALPTLVPNDVDPPDLAQLAQFIMSTASAGMTWFPDGELEKFIRDAARLPQQDEEITEIHDEQQRGQAILALAQQKMQGIQMDQQAEMGEQQATQGAQQTVQGAQAIAGTAQDQKMQVAQFAAGRQDAKDQKAQAAKDAAAKAKPATKNNRAASKGKS
jgi:Protein of unknown function (DUF935)